MDNNIFIVCFGVRAVSNYSYTVTMYTLYTKEGALWLSSHNFIVPPPKFHRAIF